MFLESAFANFFKNYGIYIVIALVVLIAVIVIVLLVTNKSKGKKSSNDLEKTLNHIIDALGGRDNIKSMDAKMSRLTISLVTNNIDVEKLKEIGIERVIKMSDKITLLIGDKAQEFADKFNK